MDKLKKEVGKRLAEIRKSKKLNQEQFKELIGAPTVQMISGWENGHSFPSSNYLIIIAKTLDISLDYLLLGRKKGSDDASVRTYKDAAIYITELEASGLFDLNSASFETYENIDFVTLSSNEQTIRKLKQELDKLRSAYEIMRPELYKQAFTELLDKYDYPIQKKSHQKPR